MAAARLDPVALRRSEDAYVDELFAGARQVDIMESLQRIEPQMQAMEREIDQLITTHPASGARGVAHATSVAGADHGLAVAKCQATRGAVASDVPAGRHGNRR